MIHGAEEVLILLFWSRLGTTALVLKWCRARLKSEVINLFGKYSNCRKNTRQKEGGGQTKTVGYINIFNKFFFQLLD